MCRAHVLFQSLAHMRFRHLSDWLRFESVLTLPHPENWIECPVTWALMVAMRQEHATIWAWSPVPHQCTCYAADVSAPAIDVDARATDVDASALAAEVSTPEVDISMPEGGAAVPSTDISTSPLGVSTPEIDSALPTADISTPALAIDTSIPETQAVVPPVELSATGAAAALDADAETPSLGGAAALPSADVALPSAEVRAIHRRSGGAGVRECVAAQGMERWFSGVIFHPLPRFQCLHCLQVAPLAPFRWRPVGARMEAYYQRMHHQTLLRAG